MSKLLLVEDDETIVENFCVLLQQEGFLIESVSGQKHAIELLEEKNYDLVLLDISLADGNGFAICSYIKQNTDIPVIFLTASGDEYSVVTGLDMGADDYITKPFQPLEAVARVKSNLRRFYSLGAGENQPKEILQVRDLTLHVDSCILKKGEETIDLTSVEFRIMRLFMENPNKVFSKQQLYEQGWEDAFYTDDNNVMVCISKLRGKLSEDPNAYIRTIRGLGYRLENTV